MDINPYTITHTTQPQRFSCWHISTTVILYLRKQEQVTEAGYSHNEKPNIASTDEKENPPSSRSSLTAIDFIRSGIVSTVIVAITDKSCTDAAPVSTAELSSRVTCGEGAALLITVVTTVICIVAQVSEWHAAAIVTGEIHGRTGVEGLAEGTTGCLLAFFPLLYFKSKSNLQTTDIYHFKNPTNHRKVNVPLSFFCISWSKLYL